MKTRAILLALLFVVPSAAFAADEFLFQSGKDAWANAGRVLDQQTLIAKYGDHFAAIVRGGTTYVVTDPAVLDRFAQLYAPVASVAHEQQAIGEKQAAIGRDQAKIGAEQAQIGADQAAAAIVSDATRSRALSARQQKLSDRQRELSDRQHALSEEQKRLSEHMKELSRDAMPKIDRLFDDAIATGKAARAD